VAACKERLLVIGEMRATNLAALRGATCLAGVSGACVPSKIDLSGGSGGKGGESTYRVDSVGATVSLNDTAVMAQDNFHFMKYMFDGTWLSAAVLSRCLITFIPPVLPCRVHRL
jgi:hypothetical protein